MKIKFTKDHKIIETETCGELREVLFGGEYQDLDLALAIDIKPTKAHFHSKFDEIYFVLDGEMTLRTFDPSTKVQEDNVLRSNELCIITKGIHHGLVSCSEHNRLCVISTPRWTADDETLSDEI